ncbi:MAG: histidine kinase [Lachnospiraceae bacterium]|nr:histidine kinase [Lachnospiraceae bacterium]
MSTKRNKKNIFANVTLSKMLFTLSLVFFIPFVLITGYLLYNLNRFFVSYDNIVQNITRANEYNITFKENMDSVVYQMIARSMNKYEVEVNLDMKSPDTLIDEAEASFEKLKNYPSSDLALGRINSILKLMETLRKRVDDIDETVKMSGYYDENMSRLDTDIRIITQLIQERITEYIYYESENMEQLRLEMEHRKNVLIQTAVVISVIMLSLSALLAFFITRSITKPIKNLCEVTRMVGKGDFEVRAYNDDTGVEITELSNSFNSMIERIGGLVDNIKAEQINSRNLELRLLQAQINPHFLYNTLDNIVWLAEDDRKEDVAAIVTALSQFFRTTLSGGRDFIRIKEEIDHVEAYLQIQKFRYRDILSYEINIHESFYDFEIIKMALQPVVENALYHGIKYKRGMGVIKIGAYAKEPNIVISVEDDGIGMNEAELEALLRIVNGKERPKDNNKGFGMANVAERLRLNYGENYGISIESEYGEGTKVEILIPQRVYRGEKIEQKV